MSIGFFLFLCFSCSRPATSKLSEAQARAEAQTDLLIEHLMNRVQSASTQLARQRNDMLKKENQCLQDEISMLNGTYRSKASSLADSKANAASESQEIQDGVDRIIQNLLDEEAVTLDYNRRHPAHERPVDQDILKSMCGDCARERKQRDAELLKEAAIFHH